LRQFKEAQAIRHSIDANKAYDIVDVEEFEAARKMVRASFPSLQTIPKVRAEQRGHRS
jgi:hypothetical protein